MPFKTTLILLTSLVLLAAALTGLWHGDRRQPQAQPLVVYCAASNRAVMEEIRQAFEAESGQSIQVQYGPSQTLLSSLAVSRLADLFLPADDSYLNIARHQTLFAEQFPIATMQLVVATRRGNPRQIESFEDLLRSEIHFVQANPDLAAVGSLTRQALQSQGRWRDLAAATDAYRTTVTEVANDIVVGAADAGIVFDAVLPAYPDLQRLDLPELRGARAHVSIGVTRFSKQREAALQFAKFITGERGVELYRKHGFGG